MCIQVSVWLSCELCCLNGRYYSLQSVFWHIHKLQVQHDSETKHGHFSRETSQHWGSYWKWSWKPKNNYAPEQKTKWHHVHRLVLLVLFARNAQTSFYNCNFAVSHTPGYLWWFCLKTFCCRWISLTDNDNDLFDNVANPLNHFGLGIHIRQSDKIPRMIIFLQEFECPVWKVLEGDSSGIPLCPRTFHHCAMFTRT